MDTRNARTLFCLTLTLALLVAACGKETATEPPATSPPVAPSPQPTAEPAVVSSFITGRVHGQAPPTPPMVVYAIDHVTGLWSFVETQQTDGEAPFTIEVPPGDYQVFAFSDSGPFAGYSQDGWSLSTVAVAEGQTVSDIVVRPPSQSECGLTFGLPASPDGRFAAIAGATQECLAAIPAPKTEPARIQFAPGAISAQVTDSLVPGELHPYVLGAMAGQEMTVNLDTSAGGMPVVGSAILVIWGLDGTVLISDHADAVAWQGELPVTQDYYVDVRSVDQTRVDYTLEVIIPPATDSAEEQGLPRVIAPEFQPFVQALVLTGVPPILPPEFPVGEGLPPIFPYIYTTDEGEYELSLDFGQDCQGAGACHYGSLTGKRVAVSVPVGTRSFPFEAERAFMVTLTQGIPGYFVESVCGANCSDALVFWIYGEYQYMLGIKSGSQSDVINLANAAIENSLGATSPQGLEPLDALMCGDLVGALSLALDVPAATSHAPFEDHVNGRSGTGCQIAANGTGLNFENINVVASALREVLQTRGWQEDVQYMGGGPGAVLTGYRQADALCLVLAFWEPSEDADCPADQPVSACELAPEQRVYTITLNCAKGMFP